MIKNKILYIFLLINSSINSTKINIWQELKKAIRNDDYENFKFLIIQEKFPEINQQAYLDFKDIKGMTLLMYAAVKGNKQIVEKLIEMGATVDLENNFVHHTARDLAKQYGHTEIVELLSKENIIECK